MARSRKSHDRPRGLTEEDKALWRRVTATVEPLDGRRPDDAPAPADPPRRPQRQADRPPAPPVATRTAAPGAIDRQRLRKIARGRQPIDSTLDLHGHTQAEAFALLVRHLRRAHGRGDRCVLVITGKGGRRLRLTDALPLAHRTRRDVDPEGGVLKRMVPLWLDGPDLSPLVQAFSPATDRHGGAGALYVLLRRVRATS